MSPHAAVLGLWFLWYSTWIAAAVFSRRTKVQMKTDVVGFHRMIASVGVLLLFAPQMSAGAVISDASGRLWPDNFAADWALFGLTAGGFAFCWWARLHLGTLWSGFVTLKEDHHIVDTGPYGLVRHPIYSGVMFSAAMTALMSASLVSFLGAAMVTLGFAMTAKIEEGFLRRELGTEVYDAYASRVGMLVPRLR